MTKKEVKKKKTKKEIEKELEIYTNDLKRLQADFENFMKTVEKEKATYIDYGKQELILKLLTILDDFDNAIKHIHTSKDKNELIKGVEMIHDRLLKFLGEEGVKHIETIGKKFDPYKHEVIQKIDGDEDIILEEIQKGYSFKDKILRPAKVKVGQGGKKNE